VLGGLHIELVPGNVQLRQTLVLAQRRQQLHAQSKGERVRLQPEAINRSAVGALALTSPTPAASI
jgi:hypothetical protein